MAIFEKSTDISVSHDKSVDLSVDVHGCMEGEDTDSDSAGLVFRFCWEEEHEVEVEIDEDDIDDLDRYELQELLEAISLHGDLESAVAELTQHAQQQFAKAGFYTSSTACFVEAVVFAEEEAENTAEAAAK